VPPTKSVMHQRSWRLIWQDCTGTRECLRKKTISYKRPDIALFEETNQMIYLIDFSMPSSSNLKTAYTENIIKYAELSIKWKKKQWKIDAVSTLPLTISATGIIPHKLHDVLKQIYLSDLLYVTIQRSVIINTCNTFRKFLCDSTFQQSVINIFTFTFVINPYRTNVENRVSS